MHFNEEELRIEKEEGCTCPGRADFDEDQVPSEIIMPDGTVIPLDEATAPEGEQQEQEREPRP